jgi:hypothetical protein
MRFVKRAGTLSPSRLCFFLMFQDNEAALLGGGLAFSVVYSRWRGFLLLYVTRFQIVF